MGYLSFDASIKIHQSDDMQARKLQNRETAVFSDIYDISTVKTARRLGCEVRHSNANINSELTLQNESLL